IPIAQDIIAESVSSFLDWNQTLEVVPVIKDLRDSWDQERLNQLKWLWQKLPNLPENEKEIINIFSKRLINKLLHEPMSRLKKGVGNGKREDFVEAVRYLHDIQNVGPEDTGDLKKIPNLPTLIDGIADVK
ncbi:MAG: hypothetical protein OSA24_06700, partial [Longimicrobiales bacterium]|nr:hypothetical protein [Longimicrobiales bacterium]